ncbi:hypothetical protein B0J17DRAFT_681312 [Rhizoctonia solani]|nr:hypothetical protein B0J17DRAFT_681312 [Rhizoctonia solani]
MLSTPILRSRLLDIFLGSEVTFFPRRSKSQNRLYNSLEFSDVHSYHILFTIFSITTRNCIHYYTPNTSLLCPSSLPTPCGLRLRLPHAIACRFGSCTWVGSDMCA